MTDVSTTCALVETSVTVNNNSPIQDYVHPDDQTQPFEMTPGFKPFTDKIRFRSFLLFEENFIGRKIITQNTFRTPLLKNSMILCVKV